MRFIAIASTFTAEPVEDPLAFWMDELGQIASIKFAPYNQVFQQLLDPNGLLATNRQGINIVHCPRRRLAAIPPHDQKAGRILRHV